MSPLRGSKRTPTWSLAESAQPKWTEGPCRARCCAGDARGMTAKTTEPTYLQLPQPRRESDNPGYATDEDPISDAASLVEEVSDAGMDPRRVAFVSFHLRLDD